LRLSLHRRANPIGPIGLRPVAANPLRTLFGSFPLRAPGTGRKLNMATLLSAPGDMALPLPLGVQTTVSAEDKVRQEVWSLLAGFYPAGKCTERRKDQRFPLPRLVFLTPVGPDGLAPLGPAIVVAGKDISERGLGFYHPHPLAHRRMIAALQTRTERWVGFLIDINWCRFTQHGWYDSGGRLLQVVELERHALASQCDDVSVG
jgi:hypothetical protein